MQLKKLNDKTIDQLFEAILSLKTIEECYIFFEDLCTVNEINRYRNVWKLRVC